MATAKKTAPKRRRLSSEEGEAASSYFATVGNKGDHVFVSSGCAGIDAALGGGWALGRVVNIVGDKSSGKTLLAIEGCANFHLLYPPKKKGTKNIRYCEAEAAFDMPYADALGFPVEAVSFSGDGDERILTIEQLHTDLERFLDEQTGPCMYVVDSLDALSDDAEQERKISDSSYGGAKPKKIGEMFRRLITKIEEKQCLLVIISQIRDKLNVTFGETKTRSGGRALDFYASHIVWLAELSKIKRTIDKVERVVGVSVRARVKKNKVGLAHREFDYPVLFGYGIDDLTANVVWLIDVGREERLAEVELSKAGYKVSITNIRDKGGDRARELRATLRAIVFEEWQKIETKFLPKASKY